MTAPTTEELMREVGDAPVRGRIERSYRGVPYVGEHGRWFTDRLGPETPSYAYESDLRAEIDAYFEANPEAETLRDLEEWE